MDYGFTHDGKVYTPDQTEVPPADLETRNREIEARELQTWKGCPDHAIGYYNFPADTLGRCTGRTTGQLYRSHFNPLREGAEYAKRQTAAKDAAAAWHALKSDLERRYQPPAFGYHEGHNRRFADALKGEG